jgi:DNA polymerase I-like protein with 3'-5' exonuclease and polymerase domains
MPDPPEIAAIKEIEMDLLPLIAEMECTGVGFDLRQLDSCSALFAEKLEWIDKQLQWCATNAAAKVATIGTAAPTVATNTSVKLGDNATLSKLLFDPVERGGLGIVPPRGAKRGKRGDVSVAEEVLESISDVHPLPSLIIEGRRLSRTLAMFLPPAPQDTTRLALMENSNIDSLELSVDDYDNDSGVNNDKSYLSGGKLQQQQQNARSNNLTAFVHHNRIYPNSNQIGASTGRFSYTSPSLHTIIHDFAFVPCPTERCPQPSPMTFSLRRAFVARHGSVLVSADYSQIEIRIIAHMCTKSGGTATEAAVGNGGGVNPSAYPPTLLEVLNSDHDVYRGIAAGLFRRVSASHVTSEERETAKQVTYGIFYGLGAAALAAKLKISVDRAESYIQQFKSRFHE